MPSPAAGPAPGPGTTVEEWFIRGTQPGAREAVDRDGLLYRRVCGAWRVDPVQAELGPDRWRRRCRGLAPPSAARHGRHRRVRLDDGLLLGAVLVGRPAGRRLRAAPRPAARPRPDNGQGQGQGPRQREWQRERERERRGRASRPRRPTTAADRSTAGSAAAASPPRGVCHALARSRWPDAIRAGGAAAHAREDTHRTSWSFRHHALRTHAVDHQGDGPGHRHPHRRRPRRPWPRPPRASCSCCSSPSCWPRPWSRWSAFLRERLPLGRGGTILVVYLGFFVTMLGLAFVVLPAAIKQAEEIIQSLPPFFEQARAWAGELRPAALARSVTALIDSVAGILKPPPPPDPDTVVEVGAAVAEAAVFLATLLTIVFFWLVEHARLQRYVLAFVSVDQRAGARDRLERDRDPARPVGPWPAHPDGRHRHRDGHRVHRPGPARRPAAGPHRGPDRGHPDRRPAARRHPGHPGRGHRVAGAGRRGRASSTSSCSSSRAASWCPWSCATRSASRPCWSS